LYFGGCVGQTDLGLQVDQNPAAKDRRRAEIEDRLRRVRSFERDAVNRDILNKILLQNPRSVVSGFPGHLAGPGEADQPQESFDHPADTPASLLTCCE